MDNVKLVINSEQMAQIVQLLNIIANNKTATTTDNSNYLNKKEVCQYLNISNNTLDKWMMSGLPYHKVCGTIRFSRLEIDKWFSAIA